MKRIIGAHLSKTKQELSLEVSVEDNELNRLIEKSGWKVDCEKILLARNMWHRQVSSKVLRGTVPLEEIIGKLNPQNPPIPSPITKNE